MKRFIVLLILITVLLCSCASAPKNVPEYQSYPLTLTGTLSAKDFSCALTVTLTDKNKANITIDSPETLKGYGFTVDNSEIWVYYDDMKADLPPVSADIPILRVVDMLCLTETDCTYIRKDKEVTVAFYDDTVSKTAVYLRRDEDIPFRIEHTRDGSTVDLEIDTLITQ